MRSNNVVLLIVLVTLSFSNAFEFTNLAEVKDLRGNSYGNSLIETISLTLQNSGSVNDVQKLLDDLLYKLNSDQSNADTTWKEEEARLKEKEAKLADDIEGLRKVILEKENRKDQLLALIDTAIKNLEQYKAQKAGDENNLLLLEKQRAIDILEYNQSLKDHDDIINAIDEVIKELKKLQGSISGQGKPAHVEAISQEIRDQNYAAAKASFVQVTKDAVEALLFAQLATTADQEALAKLIGLLNELLDNTKASRNSDTAHEENSKTAYETIKATLKADIENLLKSIADQEANKKKYEDEVAKLIKEIDDAKVLKKSKEDELVATTKERVQKEAQYNADKAEREQERKVIIKLQEIVKERLANMSKFLKEKTGAF